MSTGEFTLDNGTPTSFSIDERGNFDSALSQTDLASREHTTAIAISDLAGNQTSQTINFSVTPDFVLGPDSTEGWGAKTRDSVILGERDSYLVETAIPIELGQSLGSRTLRFDIEPSFDESDVTSFLNDQLLIYLIEPTNPSQTLLDNGTPGTPIFTLAGESASFRAGLVRYDGTTVEVDLTSLADKTSGLLKFQLLNPDPDTGSFVKVSNVTNRLVGK
ncbi:MAG: hypothetical protein HC820_05370 [Hydrococcus sp. RM1_1_31]|nr:hypothetical protein [Hydrococcus sp. RM1_1_31]